MSTFARSDRSTPKTNSREAEINTQRLRHRWSVGPDGSKTFCLDGEVVGIAESPQLAAQIVQACNDYEAAKKWLPAAVRRRLHMPRLDNVFPGRPLT
jgi:hypothetical protein